MTNELLPCPCCKGRAIHDRFELSYIRCIDCGLSTRSFLTKEEAVISWNTRPAPEQIPPTERERRIAEAYRKWMSETSFNRAVIKLDYAWECYLRSSLFKSIPSAPAPQPAEIKQIAIAFAKWEYPQYSIHPEDFDLFMKQPDYAWKSIIEGYTELVKITEWGIKNNAIQAFNYATTFITKYPNHPLTKPFTAILKGETGPLLLLDQYAHDGSTAPQPADQWISVEDAHKTRLELTKAILKIAELERSIESYREALRDPDIH